MTDDARDRFVSRIQARLDAAVPELAALWLVEPIEGGRVRVWYRGGDVVGARARMDADVPAIAAALAGLARPLAGAELVGRGDHCVWEQRYEPAAPADAIAWGPNAVAFPPLAPPDSAPESPPDSPPDTAPDRTE